jgi:hypothetical protein
VRVSLARPDYNVKLSTPLLPFETYEESDNALLEGLYDECYRSRICRALSGTADVPPPSHLLSG